MAEADQGFFNEKFNQLFNFVKQGKEQTTRTFNTLTNHLTDTVPNRITQNLGQEIPPLMDRPGIPFSQFLREQFTTVRSTFSTIGTKLFEGLQTLGSSVVGTVGQIASGTTGIVDALLGGFSGLTGFLLGSSLWSTVSGFLWNGLALPLWNLISGSAGFGGMLSSIGTVVGWGAAIIGTMSLVGEAMDWLMGGAVSREVERWAQSSTVMGSVISFLQQIPIIGEGLAGFLAPIATVTDFAMDWMMNRAGPALSFIQEIPSRLSSSFQQGFSTGIMEIGSILTESLVGLGEFLLDGIGGVIGGLTFGVGGVLRRFGLGGLGSSIQGIGQWLMTDLSGKLQSIVSSVLMPISSTINNIWTWATNLPSRIQQTIQSILGSVGVTQFIQDFSIQSIADTIGNKIAGLLSNLPFVDQTQQQTSNRSIFNRAVSVLPGFQQGGVINEPSLAQTVTGQMFTMAEREPEAIMPVSDIPQPEETESTEQIVQQVVRTEILDQRETTETQTQQFRERQTQQDDSRMVELLEEISDKLDDDDDDDERPRPNVTAIPSREQDIESLLLAKGIL